MPKGLGRLDISEDHLAVQSPAPWQCDVKQDRPVASHIEIERALIAARCDFLGFRNDGTHSGVRHVAFQRNVGIRQPLTTSGC